LQVISMTGHDPDSEWGRAEADAARFWIRANWATALETVADAYIDSVEDAGESPKPEGFAALAVHGFENARSWRNVVIVRG
jgi:hypothetical protein